MTGTILLDGAGTVGNPSAKGPLNTDMVIQSRADSLGTGIGMVLHIAEGGTTTAGMMSPGDQLFVMRNGLQNVYSTTATAGGGLRHQFDDGGLNADALEFVARTSAAIFTLEMLTLTGSAYFNLSQGVGGAGLDTTHKFMTFRVADGTANEDTVVLYSTAGPAKGLGPGTANAWDLGVSGAEWRDGWFARKLVSPALYGGDGSGEDLELRSTTHATKGNIHFGPASDNVFWDEVNKKFVVGAASPSSSNIGIEIEKTIVSGATNRLISQVVTVDPAADLSGEIELGHWRIDTANDAFAKGSTITGHHLELSRGATDSGTLTYGVGMDIHAGNAAWAADVASATQAIMSNQWGIRIQLYDTSSTTTSVTEMIGVKSIVNVGGVGSAARTIAALHGVKVDVTAITSTNKTVITDFSGIKIVTDNVGAFWRATLTNAIGLDINGWGGSANLTYTNPPEQLRLRSHSVANSIAIRQQGTTPHNRFQGAMNIGTDAAPTTGYTLDVRGDAGVQPGTASDIAGIGGTLFVDTTAVGNVGTGEDDLRSYSVPANTLATNGDYLEFEAGGTILNNANSKRLRAYFGATVIFDSTTTGGIPTNTAGNWYMRGKIIQTGAATQKAVVQVSTNMSAWTTLCTYSTPAATLSGAVTLKLTAECGSTNNNISQEFMTVQWHPNNT